MLHGPIAFVFVDETGTATNMARRYGRSPCGTRLVAAVPHGHWRTTTFVGGLRHSGIVAPLVLDGPITGPAFCAYVAQFLAPALQPGDVVVLDNLAAHKVKGVRQAIAPLPLPVDLGQVRGLAIVQALTLQGRLTRAFRSTELNGLGI